MSTHDEKIRAYEEKIRAQLQQAKDQFSEIEAQAKGKASQAEIDAINHLKTKHQAIERRHHELKTIGEAKAEQLKAELDADVAKLKNSLTELATKLKEEHRMKAG